MANKFSIKSLLDTDKIIYIAPILVFASFFHIFSREAATHGFGQIEILASLIVVGYYLWDKIATIYPHEKIWKKRIEAIVCIVASIFFALIPLAPLMTWQYYNLYKHSDRYSYSTQIIAAIATVWIGVSVMYYSSYMLLSERMAAANSGMPQSSMPTPSMAQPTQGQ
jgi:hypothetical protein